MLFGRRGPAGSTVVRAGHWQEGMGYSVRTSTGQSKEVWYYGATDVNDGQWHHWVFFLDATHMGMWLDGQLVLNVAHGLTSGDFSATTPFYVLRETNEVNRWLGDVDEFAVYRGVLSQAEILEHYNNGLGKHYAAITSEGVYLASYSMADFNFGGETSAQEAMSMALPTGAVVLALPAYHTAGGERKALSRAPGELAKMQLEAPPSGHVWRSYYYAAGVRVAVRVQGDPEPGNNGLFYLLGDHLSSTSVSYRSDGGQTVTQLYKAWGEVRYASGGLPTRYTFTGQYSHVADFGLLFYNARWYDSELGRFVQADTDVPESQGVQAWDRYAYVNNSPVNFTDPTGHTIPLPRWPSDITDIFIPVSDGWDLVAAAVCFVACGILPVHYESYGPGQGAIVGDQTSKPVLPFVAGVPLSPEAAAFNAAANSAAADAATSASTLNTPNEIGAWGEQQVGTNLPVQIQQVRPVAGQPRIYDGYFTANPNAYVEVKTSTQGAVYATQAIRNQIAIDSNFGANSGISPTWIFVNARPSGPLVNLMQQNRIPWHQLKIPW